MNMSKDLHRCKRAWKKRSKKYFAVKDDEGRITFEHFGKQNVQTWRDYTDFGNFYICHYRDSEDVAFYELYDNFCDERITSGKTIDEIILWLKDEIKTLDRYFNTLQQFLAERRQHLVI